MNRNNLKGTTTVEFAIVAVAFIAIFFGVIEVSRAFFVLNALEEATRRGARVAAVCPIGDPHIQQTAIFDSSGSGSSPILPNLTTGDIVVQYLNANGGIVANPNGNFLTIRYVRVSISNTYQTQLAIPFGNFVFNAPSFSTTLPRESLGIPNQGAITPC